MSSPYPPGSSEAVPGHEAAADIGVDEDTVTSGDPQEQALLRGPLEIQGRIAEASNGTFLAMVDQTQVVYKPVRGERPLWDFPGVVLAHREYAARVVSQSLGWNVVPPTVLRSGPLGPGMVQAWQEPADAVDPVDVCAAGPVPPGYLHVLDGMGANDERVQLVHEDTPALLRMAVFDVLVNNADRKGGHVLAWADGHRWGVDHGLTFHTDPKLRTVLWGWAGTTVPDSLVMDVRRFLAEFPVELEDLLSMAECEALRERAGALVGSGLMPQPTGEWPAIPWPPF